MGADEQNRLWQAITELRDVVWGLKKDQAVHNERTESFQKHVDKDISYIKVWLVGLGVVVGVGIAIEIVILYATSSPEFAKFLSIIAGGAR